MPNMVTCLLDDTSDGEVPHLHRLGKRDWIFELVALTRGSTEFERQLGGSAVNDADADGSPRCRGEIELENADIRLDQIPPCGAGDQELALDFLAHGRALKRVGTDMASQVGIQFDFNQSID